MGNPHCYNQGQNHCSQIVCEHCVHVDFSAFVFLIDCGETVT